MWARWEASIRQLRGLAGRLPELVAVDEAERLAGRFIAGRGALFEERIGGGYIVDGHGDLLADDIFCLDDGVRILDCLEFDDRLRWVDGLDDAAFLAMDLERIGAPGLAEKFTGWYAEYSADPAPAALCHHYTAYRALVRAKIALLRAAQGDPLGGAEAWKLAAMTLDHLQAGAVTLVLVGGLPGTGKTALAGALAGRLGFTVLSSDRIRKELAGVPAERPCAAPWQAGIYTPGWTERTYQELLRRAGLLLARGESVIADASWQSPGHRAAAAALAGTAQADLVALRCAARADVARRRLAARTGGVSDADAAIARQMAATQAPWPEAVTINTGGPAPGWRTTGRARRSRRRCSRRSRPSGHPARSMPGAQRGQSSSPIDKPATTWMTAQTCPRSPLAPVCSGLRQRQPRWISRFIAGHRPPDASGVLPSCRRALWACMSRRHHGPHGRRRAVRACRDFRLLGAGATGVGSKGGGISWQAHGT